MPSKRKKDILDGFDPNKSDSDDENFDPSETRPSRSKKQRTVRTKTGPRPRGGRKYVGSEIDDDDDEVLSDSLDEGSFGGADDDDDDEEPRVTNAAGRAARRAAIHRPSYAESDGDEDELLQDQDSGQETPKPAKKHKLITLKVPSAKAITNTRRTRAKTEDADEMVELSNSGRHQVRVIRASSRSKSPEALSRQTRNSRAAKSVKQPTTSTIEEASHETSFQPGEEKEVEPEARADDDVVEDSAAEGRHEQEGVDPVAVEGDTAMEDVDADADADAAVPVEQEPVEDSDDRPITRRSTRSTRQSISGPAVAQDEDDDDDDEVVNSRPKRTRLVRKDNQRANKANDDEISDFDPDESGDGEGSDDAAEGGKSDDGDSSGRPARGRRAAARGKKRSREDDSGDDGDELDPDELAEEAEDLKRSSRSQSRRTRRRQSTPIAYEERATRRRPAAGAMAVLPPAMYLEEEDDAPPPPSQRRGRNAAATKWQRNINSTFGPFGGAGGLGSLLGGPWGTGAAAAAGGADSDSSDDEMGARSGAVGGVGMTPTAANAPGLLGGLGGGGDLEKLGLGAAPNVGKIKDRKALADADPLGVDLSVDFSNVGGLAAHIDQLKEMVQLPLLYPELFQRFKLTPPRGVLFHGPPGTGKTLLARALANSVSSGGRKITFYMRKGADALSKWVGEAEKQLRLLFEEARKTQPSIIFFDEIDGLAPVRSSKQEQIHASIVSTLLALMDGMDGRGQVIVIGATNRPDSVDPALRRPGRFDREFYFPLPDVDARKAILDIHTKDWGISDEFKMSLAENTKGYGGADLRALCTEAGLNAIQRTYPQIYSSEQKLIVDPAKINIHSTDFQLSLKKVVASSERSTSSGAAPLPKSVAPLLRDQFAAIEATLKTILPIKPRVTALEEAMFEPYEDSDHGFGRENLQQDFDTSRVFRPRLLITGKRGMGQAYIAAAILHHFERVHVQHFDLGTIFGDGRPAEQAIVSMFTEVKRHKPSVIYIPNVDLWCETLGAPAITALVTMLNSVPPTDPILLLGTAMCEANEMDENILRDLFGYSRKNRKQIALPSADKRMEYFSNIVSYIRTSPSDFPDPHTRKRRVLEELPVAPPPPPKPKSKKEIRQERKEDMTKLNFLKLKLQPIMEQIKKSYRAFHVPVIPWHELNYLCEEADPNYVSPDVPQYRPYIISKDKEGTDGFLEVATNKFFYNLDTRVIEERISNGFYARPSDFYKDIKALVHDIKNLDGREQNPQAAEKYREKLLKANEMLSNVDVDVNGIEVETGTQQWEALYQRQLRRKAEQDEKDRKRAAKEAESRPDVDMGVQSDLPIDQEGESMLGPVQVGAPVAPDAGRTMARFRLLSPDDNNAPPRSLTNGDSVPSRPVQSGSDETQTTQPFSQMGPPQLPRPGLSQSMNSSVRATPGGTQEQQISQVSALTSLPPGVSPSAILNEASTTNDPSTTHRSSGHWSTQATNGFHTDMDNASQQLPDTQPPGSHPSGHSQLTGSSRSVPWMHSQADALAHGQLSSMEHSGNDQQTSPTSSQIPTEKRAPTMDLPNILNDPGSGGNTPSIRHSGGSATTSSSQLFIVHDEEIKRFHLTMTERTSGCTIEQLEQINRELMDTIWATKHEWNRMQVLSQLHTVFNETISDIEEMQEIGQSSQDVNTARMRDLYRSR